MPDFLYENRVGHPHVVGLDEAGCGPWAGPVVAGAVLFLDRHSLSGTLPALLNDSKKLSRLKRQKAYEALVEGRTKGDLLFASAFVGVEEIDRLNIRQAALKAMYLAVAALPLQPTYALVDGTGQPELACPVAPLVKGDSLSLSIAAASIIAKVERDQEMERLSGLFPGYGWDQNAGYGTKLHQQALDRLGVTRHHRQSFAPIQKRIAVS